MPSQTALMAAAARAAHLIVDDRPPIFADTVAAALLGERADELIGYHRANPTHPLLADVRGLVAARSRYTEDQLGGATQYVILGAGLDTFAERVTTGIRVFEVDHPATQHWKRRRLAARGVPEKVTFVAVDLESDALHDRLVGAGFDPEVPAVVSWLGVLPYLTPPAIAETLAVLGGFAPGTQLVADYLLPEGLRDEAGESYVELVAAATAERGEPWRTYLRPDEATALLHRHGFGEVRHVHQRDCVDPTLWRRTDVLRPIDLAVLAHATVTGAARARR
jgi:methyltransferase (TIGR00027 family)